MTKQKDDFDDRIFKFYQYLENRLKIENEREKHIIPDITYKQNQISLKKDTKLPATSSL